MPVEPLDFLLLCLARVPTGFANYKQKQTRASLLKDWEGQNVDGVLDQTYEGYVRYIGSRACESRE